MTSYMKNNIQNLPLKEIRPFPTVNSEIRNADYEKIKNYNKKFIEPLLYKDNYSEFENGETYPDNFLGAFLAAYNVHGDI